MRHAAGDPKNSMRPPVLAAKGTTVSASTRGGRFGIGWGNYNATCLDPTDPTTLWTSQEYATGGVPDRFTTCWVAFKLVNSSGHGKPITGRQRHPQLDADAHRQRPLIQRLWSNGTHDLDATWGSYPMLPKFRSAR